MLTLEYATQFKKDFKKIAKLPIPDVIEVGHVIKQLQPGERCLKNMLTMLYQAIGKAIEIAM